MNKKSLLSILLTIGVLVPSVIAQDAASNAQAIDFTWTLVAAFLVFFMQAGFAMLEAGFTRAKHAGNIIMKNLVDFAAGSLGYWAVGFGIMFGAGTAFYGTTGFFLSGASPLSPDGLWQYAFWMFQVVFAATAATIVSGAVAERTKFAAYVAYSFVITAIIYPVVGHWIWGGGWLSALSTPMIDFAGSTVVHSVGGWAGLAGAIMVGPRIGKYIKGKAMKIRGHSIPMAALGTMILWFGWYGFNAGSTTAGTDLTIASIAVTTTLAASAGTLAAMFLSWMRNGKSDIGLSLNGALAGLVSITAGTANMSPTGAVIVGALGGILVVYSIDIIEKFFKVDDPVGAISVHGVCGAWGTIAVGLFAHPSFGGVSGLFYGGGTTQLVSQIIGVASVFAWVFLASLMMFKILDLIIGIRAPRQDELKGLDITEHNEVAYPEFMKG